MRPRTRSGWPNSPDNANHVRLRARRLSHTRATLTIARKLARRCHHTQRELSPPAREESA
jgi:hypothetical protein